jgi:hypothetical protein
LERIRAKAIDRFGGKHDHFACTQKIGGSAYDGRVWSRRVDLYYFSAFICVH